MSPKRRVWSSSHRKEFYQRFWEKVDKRGLDECWPWLGGKQSQGYGIIRVRYRPGPGGSKPELATRVMMAMKTGRVPQDDLVVMHSCDNPICVNPAHLSYGTHQDNVNDMMAKGRGKYARRPYQYIPRPHQRGGGNHRARLSGAKVLNIARLLKAGDMTHEEIARRYHVSRGQVSRIARGEQWGHLTGICHNPPP